MVFYHSSITPKEGTSSSSRVCLELSFRMLVCSLAFTLSDFWFFTQNTNSSSDGGPRWLVCLSVRVLCPLVCHLGYLRQPAPVLHDPRFLSVWSNCDLLLSPVSCVGIAGCSLQERSSHSPFSTCSFWSDWRTQANGG